MLDIVFEYIEKAHKSEFINNDTIMFNMEDLQALIDRFVREKANIYVVKSETLFKKLVQKNNPIQMKQCLLYWLRVKLKRQKHCGYQFYKASLKAWQKKLKITLNNNKTHLKLLKK